VLNPLTLFSLFSFNNFFLFNYLRLLFHSASG
jgi:hypothetical protein